MRICGSQVRLVNVNWQGHAIARVVCTTVQVVDCSICLEEFQKGDRVRQLQPCSHVFHRACVDRWLHMHDACPLCRNAL